MFVQKCAQQLRDKLSNNTVSGRIAGMSEDSEQLIEKPRNKRFSVQIDEATDCSSKHYAMKAYVGVDV
jgi:hypothetical protein